MRIIGSNARSIKPADRKIRIAFDMRYVGQNFELAVPLGVASHGKLPKIDSVENMRARFFAVHDRFYGFHSDVDPIEIINVRLIASAALAKLGRPKGLKANSMRPKRLNDALSGLTAHVR